MHIICKMTMRIPKFITQIEFEKLYEHTIKLEKSCESKSRKKTIRQYRIAMLLGFESGMRISEIIGLTKLYSRCCRVKLNYDSEKVEGKKYTIYLCSKCNKRIDVNKDTYRPSNNDWEIEPLKQSSFEESHIRIEQGKGRKDRVTLCPRRITKTSKGELPLKIKRRALQEFFKKISKEVLGKDIHFHTLRHSFGSLLAGADRPLHEIQMLLGHSRLDTTGIYLHANPKKAIEGAMSVF